MPSGKVMSLMVLPAPPQPPTPQSLSAEYGPALEAALQQTSNKSRPAQLIVGVSYLSGDGFVWGHAQELLAGMYSLIVVLCKAQQIETGLDDGPGSVDCRVVLLDNNSTSALKSSTSLISLPAFLEAHAKESWERVYYPDSTAGTQLRDRYLESAHSDKTKLVPVAGGAVKKEPDASPTSISNKAATTLHKTVCLGGTFDYLHPGHKLLLTAGALLLDAREQCEYVIGITGDELLRKKKYAELVQPWTTRARAVVDFLATILDAPSSSSDSSSKTEEKDGEQRATFRNGSISLLCVRIHDGYGPTIEREDITCLVVSGETRSGGEAVNKKRQEQGWQPLETFIVDVLNADGMAQVTATATATATESFGAKISSSEIRKRRAEQAALLQV